ncbi:MULTISPECIES: lysine decarboxylation/transport transcriptional activator CadC [Raoultella]|jgi:transcriptional activator of cad operon|uniref:Transcriptional activator CadC n=1 Tax=Raoultella terrigena TaxID=577 RepID=A0A1V2BSX7_RAOTE|nr:MULTISPECIES: lysine decarboxylation/transport transcriptional activator CadC [Raoultella]AJF72069.1 transcriptional regulator [Raoultella ornithinolytica]MCS4270584.1 transcriptional activator of cad operon [Raoultella sp. BIGb0132]MCS4287544.1 transcriptional activator of cad operon [Raoultella terrigena]MEB7600438.1 lysine decarboxylation/transport transcriptional activator CadC [Raoultella terrigena]MEB8194475.1 lysine decarboxylation/transport transcriptional activator CadC [Raoultella
MQQPVVRVGEWLVTPSVNQISRKGRQLTLEPRLIDLLVFFARHPGEVLSRDELIDNVWTRNVVTSHVVTQSISELRKSLKDGDDSSLEYIATVPKRGYKLTVPVIWCTEEGEELTPLLSPLAPQAVPEAAAPSAPVASGVQPPARPERRKGISTFIVWGLFLLALATCVALVALSSIESRPPVNKARLLLNPRDIDIHLLNGNSCTNWASQHSYAVGLGSLVTTSLNTFSTFMVHDKTNYNINEPSSSGKTLTIEFVNQRHYRAQQCFMSVQMVDNADGSTMMDKRYFITSDNQLSIQNDLLNSLSEALKQPWPERMQTMLKQYQPSQSVALTHFYQSHQLLMNGDVESLGKASALLDDVIKQAPDFTYAYAEKALVDVLRHSQQPLDEQQLAALYAEINRVGDMPGIKDLAVFYQIKAVDMLGQGKVDEAYHAINTGIDMEMSWMNYVLLGKVYEMKGENREAADAYLTAFNLRPGENTFYWIENAVFQTSVTRVVPYLDNFLSSE